MQPATQGEENGSEAMQFPAAQKELESHCRAQMSLQPVKQLPFPAQV